MRLECFLYLKLIVIEVFRYHTFTHTHHHTHTITHSHHHTHTITLSHHHTHTITPPVQVLISVH